MSVTCCSGARGTHTHLSPRNVSIPVPRVAKEVDKDNGTFLTLVPLMKWLCIKIALDGILDEKARHMCKEDLRSRVRR